MHKLFSLFISVMLSSALHGMEMALSNDNRDLALDVFSAQSLLNNDYDTYRTIAMLSTTHNKIIENNYRPKKKCIERHIQQFYAVSPDVAGYISWNEDFSKCAWVKLFDETEFIVSNKSLRMVLLGVDNNNLVIERSNLWDHFHFPIFEDNIRPFFNKEGRACFYAYGDLWRWQKYHPDAVKYSIGFDNRVEIHGCMVEVLTPNGLGLSMMQSLPIFFNFPVLLQAFLQSKRDRVISSAESRLYHIKGMTLPDGYKTFKKHKAFEKYGQENGLSPYLHTSYDLLPDDLQKAVDAKYKEQQDEKMNTNKL